MRRLGLALVLSLGVHAWLLSAQWHWKLQLPTLSRANAPVSIDLSYLPKPQPPKAPKVFQPPAARVLTPPQIASEIAPPAPPPPKRPKPVVKPKPKPRVRPSKPKPPPSPVTAKKRDPAPLPPIPSTPVLDAPAAETTVAKTLPPTQAPPPLSPAPPASTGAAIEDTRTLTANIIPTLKKATPLYKRNPAPQYPRLAKRRGYQGTVVLEVLVSAQGRVEDLKIMTSSGYAVLDKAATASVKTWLFEPGTRADHAVAMWVRVPVRFQLQ